jgi:hypothetical protein
MGTRAKLINILRTRCAATALFLHERSASLREFVYFRVRATGIGGWITASRRYFRPVESFDRNACIGGRGRQIHSALPGLHGDLLFRNSHSCTRNGGAMTRYINNTYMIRLGCVWEEANVAAPEPILAYFPINSIIQSLLCRVIHA